jgi:hypothetical protein
MTFRRHPKILTSVTTLSLRWMVLVVIMLGVMLSSIGMTNSHGIASIAALHEAAPSLLVAAQEHAHEHSHDYAGHDKVMSVAEQDSGSDHPHHDLDHSHDTAAHLPQALRASLAPRLSWDALVLGMNTDQSFRRYRPPMG